LLDVMVNGKLIARGEVVAQGDRFGLRIVELMGTEPDAGPAPVTASKKAAKGDAA
jgi:flagellar motor switch protein FliN